MALNPSLCLTVGKVRQVDETKEQASNPRHIDGDFKLQPIFKFDIMPCMSNSNEVKFDVDEYAYVSDTQEHKSPVIRFLLNKGWVSNKATAVKVTFLGLFLVLVLMFFAIRFFTYGSADTMPSDEFLIINPQEPPKLKNAI